MKITVAKNIGFCFGVQNAIEIARINSVGGIYTLGALIHNERVVNDLIAEGIKPIDNPCFISKGEKVLIRAHGVSPVIKNQLLERGAIVFDATCPLVKKVHDIVSEYSTKGYKIIIIGEESHPEVQGVLGFTNGNAEVISNCDKIDLSSADKYCVVSQTTFSEEKYEDIVKNIQISSICYNKIVVFFNTICYTTKARQAEAFELSKINDVVFVVGSKTSSNANKLFDISSKNCRNTFLIENLADVKSALFNINFNTLAVMAAASTPQELIEEVLSYMSDTQNTNLETTENEVVEIATAATVAEPTVVLPEAEVQHKHIKELTMDDIIASDKSAGFTTYREGKRVKAKIINADDSGIFCEIGGKKDGFIDKSEVNIDTPYNPADFKVGDIVEAKIINKKGDSTYVTLSKREIDLVKKDDEVAEKAFESKEFTLEPPLKIVKNKEGNPVGLEGRLGAFTVFIPGSQIRAGRVKNLEDYLEKKLRLRMLQKNGRRVTASQRVILEEEKASKDEEFWASIVPNAIVKGKVKRFASFGAFVSVKGYDCLAHVSDLSWKKITDPSTVLTIGETYDFVVLKADRESGKISLGYKQLQKKPYEVAAEKYPVGTIITGTVARIHPFGAFVQIEEGIDGLIHVSQISHKFVKEASELLKEGDEVTAKIIGFEGNRITLSIKELLPVPEVEAKPVANQNVSNNNNNNKVTNNNNSENENKPKAPRPPRTKKFEYDPTKSDDRRRDRSDDRNKSDEPHEWVSDSGVATLADLLKGFDLKFTDDDENK